MKRTGIFFPQFVEAGVQGIHDLLNVEMLGMQGIPKNLFHVSYDPVEKGIRILFQCDWKENSPLCYYRLEQQMREFPLLIVCHEDSTKRFDAPCMQHLWGHTKTVSRENAMHVIRICMDYALLSIKEAAPSLTKTTRICLSGTLTGELLKDAH